MQFKTFEKYGSSLVTASVSLCLMDWSVASSHRCFHGVTAPSEVCLAWGWVWGLVLVLTQICHCTGSATDASLESVSRAEGIV